MRDRFSIVFFCRFCFHRFFIDPRIGAAPHRAAGAPPRWTATSGPSPAPSERAEARKRGQRLSKIRNERKPENEASASARAAFRKKTQAKTQLADIACVKKQYARGGGTSQEGFLHRPRGERRVVFILNNCGGANAWGVLTSLTSGGGLSPTS